MFFKRYYEQKTILRTIDRVVNADGQLEYRMVTRNKVDIADLPPSAVHVTGEEGVHALIDMKPNRPDYAEGAPEFDENGLPTKAHNYADAIGYHEYYVDTRMDDAEKAVAEGRPGFRMEPRKLITIILASVVVAFVVWRFVA